MKNNNYNRLEFELKQSLQNDIEVSSPLLVLIDPDMTFVQVLKSAIILSISTLGSYKAKENNLYIYSVTINRLISDETYMQLVSLTEIMPGSSLHQILLSIFLIKTQNIFISLIGITLFTIPGILLSLLVAFFFAQYPSILINTYPNYIYQGLTQSGLGLLIAFCIEELEKISQSSFQVGIVVISSVVLFLSNNLLTVIILFSFGGYLATHKKESQFLLYKASQEFSFNNNIFLGRNCFIIFILVFITLILLNLYFSYDDIDFFDYTFHYYTLGSLIFSDYSSLSLLTTIFKRIINQQDALNAFAVISLFQGDSINMVGYLMYSFLIEESNLNRFLYSLYYVFICYLPSILINLSFIKWIPFLNNFPDIQFWLKGMRTVSIGFIFSSIPRLYYFSCFNDKISYNWKLATVIIGLSMIFCFKQRMYIGYIVTIGLAILFSII